MKKEHFSLKKLGEWFLLILALVYVITLIVSLRATARREVNLPENFANAEFGKFVEINEDRIYYERYPSFKAREAPELVFIHGFGSSSKTWQSQVQYFRNEFNLTLVDLAGFGLSQDIHTETLGLDTQTAILRQLLQKLSIPKASIVGHSMGAAVAMRYALDFPDSVDKLVLLAPTDLGSGIRLHSLSWLNHPLLAQIPMGLLINRGNLLFFLQQNYIDRSLITDDQLDDMFGPYTIKGATSNLLRTVFASTTDRTVETGRIKNPILVLTPEQDQVIQERVTRDLLRGLTDPLHYEIPNAGHSLHYENPLYVNPVIMDFLLTSPETDSE